MFWNKHRGSTARVSRPMRRSATLRVEQLESRVVPTVTTTLPYLVPVAAGVEFTALLTVGDAVPQTGGGSPYRMVGIPDGLGAFDNGNGTFTVLMNHELPSTSGIVRDHGSKGAFVSKFVIDKATLNVLEGDDLIKSVMLFDVASGTYIPMTTAFQRLCSADLPDATAFFNAATGKGTTARIFMDGEETDAGRGFAHIVTGASAGTSFELPRIGKLAFENAVASPFAQDKTIVVSLDDADRTFSTETPNTPPPSEVYVYVGTKQTTGTDVAKAGLTNGLLYGVKATGALNEEQILGVTRFTMFNHGDVTAKSAAALQADATANQVTQFRRVEDGAWDPKNPRDFYFVTTDQFGGNTRLWRLRFDDIANPEAGGTIEVLIEGKQVGAEMFDNIAIDQKGRVILQEDIGNQVPLGKIWIYDIATGSLTFAAQHNPKFFTGNAITNPDFITQDEESSGVIDVSHILGEGTYLMDVQAHASAGDTELVQKGQLLVMKTKSVTAGVHQGNLVVLGSDQADNIKVCLDEDEGELVVKNGNNVVGRFDAADVSHITVDAYGGHDKIQIDEDIDFDTFLRGGAGNDEIRGGSGSDLIMGDGGNDKLYGRDGRDLLFGGLGLDELDGGSGSDFLLGGITAYDQIPASLRKIQDVWTDPALTYNQRLDALRTGSGGVPKLDATTVIDDQVKDKLKGGSALDWFWAGVLDTVDKKAGEQFGPPTP